MTMASSPFTVRRGRRGVRRFGGSRRGFEWENLSVLGAAITATPTSTEIMTAAEIDEMSQSATFVRIRGMMTCQINVSGNTVVWFGICLLPTTVVAGSPGVGVPNPAGDGNWNGWLWHQGVPLVASSAPPSTDVRDVSTSAARFMIDNRGKRRLQEDTHLLFVVGSTTVTPPSFSFDVAFRFGIQLARR